MLHKEDHPSWTLTSWLQLVKLLKEQRLPNLSNTPWLPLMKVSIKVNSPTERDKALEPATGRTNPCMRASGSMGSDQAMESSWDLARALSKDSGFTTERMAKVFNVLRMAILSMGSGSKTNWTAVPRFSTRALRKSNSWSTKTECRFRRVRGKWARTIGSMCLFPFFWCSVFMRLFLWAFLLNKNCSLLWLFGSCIWFYHVSQEPVRTLIMWLDYLEFMKILRLPSCLHPLCTWGFKTITMKLDIEL